MFHYGGGINFLPEVDAAIHALFWAMAIEGGAVVGYKRSLGLCLIFCLFALASQRAQAAEELRLLTNIAPPYQEMVDGELDGTSMRALDCIMARLGQPYSVGLAPWLRARQQVRQGTIDGFFSVAPDAEAPHDANLSLPLALERWVWVTRDGTAAPILDGKPGTGRMAAVLGSNPLKWLQSQGLEPDAAARNAAQLLRMLSGGRVQAVLMDESELHAARREAGVDAVGLTVSFQRYMPLGVYFSPAFLAAHPGFLDRFNHQVGNCAAGNLSLSPPERRAALAAARHIVEKLKAIPDLGAMLRRSGDLNAAKPFQQITDEDRDFQDHRAQAAHPMVAALRDHPLGAALAELRADSDGAAAELLLFDRTGVAVAADPLPSDLWQGDEAKFQMTVPKGPDIAFVDTIAFDRSTGQFTVQVSISLGEGDGGVALGALTIGLNIERVLNRPS